MAGALFSNFASAALANIVNVGDTALTLATGQGSQFPTPAVGEWFYVVLTDSLTAPTRREVVKVLTRVGDVFTVVVRGQDGTPAQAWIVGNFCELRLTAAAMNELLNGNDNLSDLVAPATARTNLGLGTMATQNANAVAITGGSFSGGVINNTVIGNTTPQAGTFSSLGIPNNANTTTGPLASNTNPGGIAQVVYALANGGNLATWALNGINYTPNGLFVARGMSLYASDIEMAYIADNSGRMDFAVGGIDAAHTQLALTQTGPQFPNQIPVMLAGSYKPVVSLYQSAVPCGLAPTGTMAANGAVTLGTGLQTTYTSCYLHFVAGAVFAGSPAGFYYCVMSSTTVGTVFNNLLPATGIPTIPGSPTPIVAAGPGAFVGSTAEIQGPTLVIPAGIMGNYGKIEINNLWAFTIAAGSSQFPRIRWGSFAGNVILGPTISSTIRNQLSAPVIANRGIFNQQVSGNSNSGAYGSQVGASAVYSTQNTNLAQQVVFTFQRVDATDVPMLEDFTIKLMQTP